MIEVGAPPEVMTMIGIATLHITSAAALGDDAAVSGTID
jgi:hypothetical protein